MLGVGNMMKNLKPFLDIILLIIFSMIIGIQFKYNRKLSSDIENYKKGYDGAVEKLYFLENENKALKSENAELKSQIISEKASKIKEIVAQSKVSPLTIDNVDKSKVIRSNQLKENYEINLRTPEELECLKTYKERALKLCQRTQKLYFILDTEVRKIELDDAIYEKLVYVCKGFGIEERVFTEGPVDVYRACKKKE